MGSLQFRKLTCLHAMTNQNKEKSIVSCQVKSDLINDFKKQTKQKHIFRSKSNDLMQTS